MHYHRLIFSSAVFATGCDRYFRCLKSRVLFCHAISIFGTYYKFSNYLMIYTEEKWQ